MRSLAEINERIQELEASMPNASRFPASYNRVRGRIEALRWVLSGDEGSQKELLLEAVPDALIEFGDPAMERRVGPGDIEAWVDKWLKRESLVVEARKGYHEANHPVSSQYA